MEIFDTQYNTPSLQIKKIRKKYWKYRYISYQNHPKSNTILYIPFSRFTVINSLNVSFYKSLRLNLVYL